MAVISPKVRGFICTNAHPTGCEHAVSQQINYVKTVDFEVVAQSEINNVLIIGSSTGYGLASRIVSAFGFKANTLGVCFEKPPTEKKTASAGWYNTCALHDQIRQDASLRGTHHDTINGDAYSDEVKAEVIEHIQRHMGTIDLVIYSLASPKRVDPNTGEVYKSVLKPVGQSYQTLTYDTDKDEVLDVTLEPATDEEIENTIKVMGGADWERWIAQLHEAQVLSNGVKTTAYTYIGKELTWPIYGNASIGKAKEDLDRAAHDMVSQYAALSLDARVTSLKALVTQASSAIPVMPLYISLMYKVMKDEGSHQGCIEQICWLFKDFLFNEQAVVDDKGRFRLDVVETNAATQEKIKLLWDQVNNDNFHEISDYAGYKREFLNLFGFGFDQIDYAADVELIKHWS